MIDKFNAVLQLGRSMVSARLRQADRGEIRGMRGVPFSF